MVGCEACPEVPRAITAMFAATFSLACTPVYCTFPLFTKTFPPSLIANPAANLSQCLAISIRMLASPPVSSSAVARKITSRFRWAIERFNSMNTARLAASIPLSSMAPRPYMYPSFITPANGSTLHRDLSTGTVSKCATSKSALEDSAIADLCNRATTALRPGVKSSSSALIPSFARTPATYIAAICSFPGGFVVLILMRSVSQPCASLAIAEVLPIGDGLPGIPGPPAGETCAAIGKLAAIANAAVPAMLWTIRFQFTNPSSS